LDVERLLTITIPDHEQSKSRRCRILAPAQRPGRRDLLGPPAERTLIRENDYIGGAHFAKGLSGLCRAPASYLVSLFPENHSRFGLNLKRGVGDGRSTLILRAAKTTLPDSNVDEG